MSPTPDPDRPVVLTEVGGEIEGEILVAALEDRGIRARQSGGMTAGFRAEVPGRVKVLVREGDLPAAQRVLEEIRPGSA